MPSPREPNVDQAVIDDFGREWQAFDQSGLSEDERARWFDAYFSIFPWQSLPEGAVGFDAGCGSGRWAVLVAERVGHLHCVDPSQAIDVARRNLAGIDNVSFHNVSIDQLPFADASMDFGYSLGVLHHIPDTQRALSDCVAKLKPGAPFLVYLYYAFDNRPWWFRAIWRVSDIIRRGICLLPSKVKIAVTQVIAALVYWPLARIAGAAGRLGLNVSSWPLSGYRGSSFYTMRTDALDRFGTRLEQRFTRVQIEQMMRKSGLGAIHFSDGVPFHCAVGVRDLHRSVSKL